MKLLLEHLKMDPCLYILTGPVNSGKSLILKKLKNHLKAQHVPVMDINLREISFSSVDTLVDTLKEATNSWLEQFKEAVQHFKLDAKAYGFEIKVTTEGSSLHPL